jgi:hypothetical protein
MAHMNFSLHAKSRATMLSQRERVSYPGNALTRENARRGGPSYLCVSLSLIRINITFGGYPSPDSEVERGRDYR